MILAVCQMRSLKKKTEEIKLCKGQERGEKTLYMLEWDMSECVSVLCSSARDLEIGMYYWWFKEINWNLCVCQQWEPNLNLTAVVLLLRTCDAAAVWCVICWNTPHIKMGNTKCPLEIALCETMSPVQMGQVALHFVCLFNFLKVIGLWYSGPEVSPLWCHEVNWCFPDDVWARYFFTLWDFLSVSEHEDSAKDLQFCQLTNTLDFCCML